MKNTFSKIYICIVFLFLYFPIGTLIAFSFNASKSRAVWSGFTLHWYKTLFADGETLKAIQNTFIIASTASILATIIGTAAAIGILKLTKWPRKIIMNITNLPMVNPEIVTGISFMLLFTIIQKSTGLLEQGILTLIISHTTFCLPYVILSVLPKLRQVNFSIYEAALDLGCTPFRAFVKVVLRDIMPGIITGAIMAFTLSIDDFVVSYFTSGATQTLSISIYSMSKRSISPEINALSSILFLLILALLLVVNFRKSEEAPKEIS
ncbi:MAG: ABC transporter permease [Oscillospiraceae bacterium]|nr:ABC transporter permease [Oscillospiraceae bacterium]